MGARATSETAVERPMMYAGQCIGAVQRQTLACHRATDRRMRLEHWDNALHQGKQAGRNMAGANEPYTYMSYFFSDLFEFSYEAVGDVTSKLDTVANWKKENDNRVRGVMMCNVWDKVPAARDLIAQPGPFRAEDLNAKIAPGWKITY